MPLGRHVYTLKYICYFFLIWLYSMYYALYVAEGISCRLACRIKIMIDGSEDEESLINLF
jgi:hypothetical protein